MIELVKINQVSNMAIEEFKKEFLKNKEIIHGSNGLTTESSIKKWRIHISKIEIKPSSNQIKTIQYFIIDNQCKLVGIIDLRHHLNSYLQQEGGHIGYSIRKSERGKGYSKIALKKILLIAKEKYLLKQVLLTCNASNDISRKTIISNNGVLTKIITLNNNEIEHYWISL